MAAPHRRELPERANLAQQKTLAKELLRAFAAGETEAVARVRAVLPDKTRIVLADAQFVLAREYGLHDWAALKARLEARAAAQRSPEEAMHHAMQHRDAPAVRRLLAQHARFRAMLDAPVFAFDAPALVACADDAAMVDVLLEFGADPNRRSGWWAGGFHPLHIATGAAAERLLAAGAVPDACAAAHLDRPDWLADMLARDPARVHERGGDGQTPLHFARSRAVADLLLDAGADPDARDVDHRATPAEWMLDRARDRGRYALARHLVARGASTDLFLAAALGLTDRVRDWLAREPARLADRTGEGRYGAVPPSSQHIYQWSIGPHRTPLEVAAQFGHDETVQAMLPFASPAQRLRLHARTGDLEAARALAAEQPTLVPTLPPEERRLISDAAWNGDAPAVAVLLALGFDPATPGHDGGTALHCAAWQGRADIIDLLLGTPSGRALLPVRDPRYDHTPLGWCCHGSRNGPRDGAHLEVARRLLAAGAAPEDYDASDEIEALLEAARTP